jgi:hypothetical protein
MVILFPERGRGQGAGIALQQRDGQAAGDRR